MDDMKDNDDRTTTRGTRLGTGLIPPSTTSTPDTPGEALKRSQEQAPLVPPAIESVPHSSPEDEDAKCPKHFRNPVALSTSIPHATASLKRHLARPPWPRQEELHDDQFVIHMPSARKPQPFSYPGYTATQIEALEYYRRKARRASKQGYDRRRLHGSGEGGRGGSEEEEATSPRTPRGKRSSRLGSPSSSPSPWFSSSPAAPTAAATADETENDDTLPLFTAYTIIAPPKLFVRKRDADPNVARMLAHGTARTTA